MPTPPGRYTRQQICDLALNRAGNRSLDRDAKLWLGQTLFDLYTLYDWPFLCVAQAMTITGPAFALPTDFMAAQDDVALRPTSWDGQGFAGRPLLELDRATFDQHAAEGSGGVPLYWHADRANNLGLVAPDPAGHALWATLRYKRLPPEPAAAAEAADVPVFPWHTYLVQAVYVTALQHERDARALPAKLELDAMLATIRRGAFPLRTQAPTIPLDPTVFSTPFQGD